MADETVKRAQTTFPQRFDSIDVLRGLALLAMAVFHTSWDLSFLGIANIDVAGNPGWQIFARSIASTFLFIAGAGLVLSWRQGFRPRAYFKRLAVIIAAAAAVSFGTYYVMGDQFVAFGILHHIAAASLVGLAAARLPAWMLICLVPAALALPYLIKVPGEGYGLAYFLGLAPDGPPSVDYVPLFPWLAAGFAGMAAGKLLLRFSPEGLWTRWRAENFLTRLAAFAGRWSLAVYLVHQPIILAVLYGLASTLFAPSVPVNDPAAGRFHEECQRVCIATGLGAEQCDQACHCTENALRRERLWTRTLNNSLSSAEVARLQGLARACTPER